MAIPELLVEEDACRNLVKRLQVTYVNVAKNLCKYDTLCVLYETFRNFTSIITKYDYHEFDVTTDIVILNICRISIKTKLAKISWLLNMISGGSCVKHCGAAALLIFLDI